MGYNLKRVTEPELELPFLDANKNIPYFRKPTAMGSVNVVRLTLLSHDEQTTKHLFYEVFPTYIGEKYKKLLWQETREKDWKFYETEIFGLGDETDLPVLKDKFVEALIIINTLYDRELVLPTVETLNKALMNHYHHEFEIYGDRIKELLAKDWWGEDWEDPSKQTDTEVIDRIANFLENFPYLNFNEELHYAFLGLNRAVHQYEALQDNIELNKIKPGKTDSFIQFSVGDQKNTIPFDALDYYFFRSEYRWGDVLLGYNTLGKHISEIVNSNDIDCVIRGEIRVQDHLSTEVFIPFQGNPLYDTKVIDKLVQWIIKNNLKETNPWHDSFRGSIGYGLIGRVIYPDTWDGHGPFETGMARKLNWSTSYMKDVKLVNNVELYKVNLWNRKSLEKMYELQGMVE